MPGTAADAEELYWAVVKDSRNAGELFAYLGIYPQGKFSAAARARLAAIAHAPTVAVQQPVAPAATVLVPPASNYNAERDRRTEELRAELAASGRPESSVPAPVAARPSAAATPGSPRRNAQGYTVGDKWNYQVIDKWKGEVIRNYALQVGKILPDGGWVTPRGGAEFDEHGRWKKLLRADGERWQSVPFAPRWWPDMKVGETRRFQYRQTGTPVTGNGWVNDVDLEGRVMGIETIKVPAGEFRAYRVEFKGSSTAVGRFGVGRSTLTYWYAPELHTLVAYEGESTWNGRLDVREREELTSYVLVNPPAPR